MIPNNLQEVRHLLLFPRETTLKEVDKWLSFLFDVFLPVVGSKPSEELLNVTTSLS